LSDATAPPDPEHAVRLAAGRALFSGAVDFMRGVISINDLPDADMPEIAFAGRSNVGKSSLINALTGRKKLARASTEPGRTRELNFFDMSGRMRIVDLPGYGYAKAPKDVAARWIRLTRSYLWNRVNLKRVFLLIDSRHGIKPSDEELMDVLDSAAVGYQVVLTKIDKLTPAEVHKRLEETAGRVAGRPAAFPEISATSSTGRNGLDELRGAISTLALS